MEDHLADRLDDQIIEAQARSKTSKKKDDRKAWSRHWEMLVELQDLLMDTVDETTIVNNTMFITLVGEAGVNPISRLIDLLTDWGHDSPVDDAIEILAVLGIEDVGTDPVEEVKAEDEQG